MKILLISGSRIVGGAERASLQLVHGLVERGHSVEVLCPAGEWRAALATAGLRIHPAPLGGSLNLIAPFIIARAVAKVRPDLLMVTTSDEWVWSCLTPLGNPLVLVRHMAIPLALRVRRLAGWRAAAIVAVSRTVRESLLADSAIAPGLVHVIPNAMRFAARTAVPDHEDRRAARAALGIAAAGRWVGFLGGINRGKGIEDVMAAARHANETLGDVRLLVCGRKDPRRDTPECAELALRYGLEDRVHYLEHIDDVKPALIAADVVAIATRSTLGEGLAQTAIDAMACGTPIAAYALGRNHRRGWRYQPGGGPCPPRRRRRFERRRDPLARRFATRRPHCPQRTTPGPRAIRSQEHDRRLRTAVRGFTRRADWPEVSTPDQLGS